MDSRNAWNDFLRTGAPERYMEYCAQRGRELELSAAEGAARADINRGPHRKGKKRGGR